MRSRVIVIYDSQTGFTEEMAKAVVVGARSVKGTEVERFKIGIPFSISIFDVGDAIIMGSPVIFGGVTHAMKTLLESMKAHKASNRLKLCEKVGGAFGSYAFSGGWVIRALSDEMEALGIRIVTPAIIAVDGMKRQQPIHLEENTLQSCIHLGVVVAEKSAQKKSVRR